MLKMKYNLPTKEECDAICEKTDAFYKAERVIEGQNVVLYDYRLASISDFVDNDAFELRGICFVQNEDSTWERNILLNKFFNVGQTEGWLLDEVKDKKIVRVQNKEDGSVISFVRFSNGKVRAKSKMSFESDQAVLAQKVYNENKEIQRFVSQCFRENKTPVFELVGYLNQIVLNYKVSADLILLQVRRNFDGSYVHNLSLDAYDIEVAEEHDDTYKNLDFLLDIKENSDEDIEGFVVTFEDGQMAKIKLNKYLELHGLIGPDAFRENLLVQSIINGSIDDVIAALVPGPKKDSIISMEEKVSHKFNSLVQDFIDLRKKYFTECHENRKNFAIKYSKTPMFGSVIKTVNVKDDSTGNIEKLAEKSVKEYILKVTNSLSNAKIWVESL